MDSGKLNEHMIVTWRRAAFAVALALCTVASVMTANAAGPESHPLSRILG